MLSKIIPLGFILILLFVPVSQFTPDSYADLIKTLSVEKGEELILSVYLDENNLLEQVESMYISISFNSEILLPKGVRLSNGFLSTYSCYDILQVSGKATAIINGTGVNIQSGLVVEFIMFGVDTGKTNVVVDSLNCNDHNISGGFWVENDHYQRIYVQVIEADVFHISEIENRSYFEDQLVDPIPFSINLPGGNTSGFIATSAVSSNTDLIPNGDMEIKGVGTQRHLYIVPALNAFGTAQVTIFATYNWQQQISQTFSIAFLPVNDAPTFSIPSAITLVETSGPQLFTNWVTNISPGAENEQNQTLNFIISVDQPDLFYLPPEIDPVSGDLKLFPVDNRHGQALLSVCLQDDGDTSNDGHNLSSKMNCLVTITPFSPLISDYPVEKLKFVSSNQAISPQKVTPYIRIMACDANGDAVIMESDTRILLQTESPDTGWFYVKETQWTWNKSNAFVVIPEGQYSALFKYRNGRPGSFQIKASELPEQNWADASMNIVVQSGDSDTSADIDGNGCVDLKDVILEMQFLSK